jgi:hypothetical protein
MKDANQAGSWNGEPDDDATGHPAGEIRIRSAHVFGLRAAALAGLVVTTATTVAVVSPLATLAAGPGTICCVSGP